MILLGFFILGIGFLVLYVVSQDTDNNFLKKNGDDILSLGVILLIIAVIVFVGCIFNYMEDPANLQADYIKLGEKQEYLATLPKLPVEKEIQEMFPSINIDLPNQEIAKEIVKARIEWFKQARSYNKSIVFWTHYPKFAFVVWGWPNPATGIKALNLKLIHFKN